MVNRELSQIAQDKLQQYITAGQGRAQATVQKILTETPEDRIVRAHAVKVMKDEDALAVWVPDADAALAGRRFTLHDNALQQVAARTEIPLSYVRDLNGAGSWGRRLLAENFNTLLAERFNVGQRFLIRSVGTQARAFLSDRFRRLDSRPVVDAMIGAVQEAGGIISDGYAGDVQVAIKAILPELVEPVPGEFMVFGLNYRNSDYGRGATEVSAFALRVLCTNAHVLEDLLRQIHLGSRLGDDLTYSERTYALDTATVTSAVKDVTRNLLGRERIERTVQRIQQAASEQIDTRARLQDLLKRNRLSKGEAEAVAQAFNGPDVELLPAGNTAWRFSNALSFVAGKTQDGDRKLELEALAGEVLPTAA